MYFHLCKALWGKQTDEALFVAVTLNTKWLLIVKGCQQASAWYKAGWPMSSCSCSLCIAGAPGSGCPQSSRLSQCSYLHRLDNSGIDLGDNSRRSGTFVLHEGVVVNLSWSWNWEQSSSFIPQGSKFYTGWAKISKTYQAPIIGLSKMRTWQGRNTQYKPSYQV